MEKTNELFKASILGKDWILSSLKKTSDCLARVVLAFANPSIVVALAFLISFFGIAFICVMYYLPFVVDKVFLSISMSHAVCLVLVKLNMIIFVLRTTDPVLMYEFSFLPTPLGKNAVYYIISFTLIIDAIFLYFHTKHVIKLRKALNIGDISLQIIFFCFFLLVTKGLTIFFYWPILNFFSILSVLIGYFALFTLYEFVYSYTKTQKRYDNKLGWIQYFMMDVDD